MSNSLQHPLSAEPYTVLEVVTREPDHDVVTEIATVSFEGGHITDADDAHILPSFPASVTGDLLLKIGPEVIRRARSAAVEPFLATACPDIRTRTLVAYDAARMRELLGMDLRMYCCREAVSQIFGGDARDDVDRERKRLTGAYRRAVFIGSVFYEALRTTTIAQPHRRLRDFHVLAAPSADLPEETRG